MKILQYLSFRLPLAILVTTIFGMFAYARHEKSTWITWLPVTGMLVSVILAWIGESRPFKLYGVPSPSPTDPGYQEAKMDLLNLNGQVQLSLVMFFLALNLFVTGTSATGVLFVGFVLVSLALMLTAIVAFLKVRKLRILGRAQHLV